MSYEKELYRAFCEKNLSKFAEALDIFEVNPNNYHDGKETIFECILKSPESAEFIEKCIKHGANFNVKRPSHASESYTYPIHHIIQSGSFENLEAVEHLLETKKTDADNKIQSPYVNVKDKDGKNCLHLLIEQLTNTNFNDVYPMIKTVVKYGCNINATDNQGRTPLVILESKTGDLKHPKKVFNYLSDNTSIDLSAHGKLRLSGNLFTNVFSNEKVANVFNVNNDKDKDKEVFEVNFQNLMELLNSGDINKFETKFPLYEEDAPTYKANCEKFLKKALKSNYINIVDLILNSTANVNDLQLDDGPEKIPLLFWAYKQANLEVFSIILMHPQVQLYFKDKTLLHHFFDKFTSIQQAQNLDDPEFSNDMATDEKKCFDFLLNSPKCSREYLNAEDDGKHSAIYYSVKFGVDYMTKRLLEKGAYIGPVITNIRKSLLNDFLDSCITSNSKFQDDKEFQLDVNYTFLEPPIISNENKSDQTEVKITDPLLEPIPKKQPVQYAREMIPLKALVENVNLQRLIMHPVLSSFVFLKWSKIQYLVHFNLILTLLYIFSFIPLVIINVQRASSGENIAEVIYLPLFYISFASLVLLIIREFSQLILSPVAYVRVRANWIDMALIFASLAILYDYWSHKYQLSMLHPIIILLATWEYFNLLGYLPILSVSLHTKIFRKVFMTFFKSLAFYSVMIIGFALSFYTLHGDKFTSDLKEFGGENLNDDGIEVPKNTSRSDRYNNFYTVGHSIIKSYVMLTGELDSSNIQLEGFAYSALFVLYFFIVTIVLYNLLNALAVSDTQEIKVDAKLIDLEQRVLTMYSSELSIFDGFVGERSRALGRYLKERVSLFPHIIQNGKLIFKLKSNEEKSNSNLKLSNEILTDMCSLLVMKREERAADRANKIKERTTKKLSDDIAEIFNMINDIHDRK
ncbi:transient receptor potential cation channel protein painless-like [Chironomus tepperi]|uniref:transient receptor potential cation channel protein painless-like n=1 Tax=Chironomus tepperi TaxID=113505 RepID=UPI00391F6D51